ncbi:MAG: protein translocase subunit SecD [Deltaproteobacteria bacterium]|nr:MAG: protein translocase subunit SecD [Deltaproteobacteria bacterium]
MKRSILWRASLIIALTVVSVFVIVPSLTGKAPEFLKEKIGRIHLGLDLQGGIFLRLQVDLDKAIENTISRYADDARASLREKGIPVLSVRKVSGRSYEIVIPPGEFVERAKTVLNDRFGNLDVQLSEVRADQAKFVLSLKDGEVNFIRTNAVKQAVETIRNRIDQFGVREPQIVAEGEDRIVVQLPGIKEKQRAIDIIGKTALLEFKLVDEEHSLEDALAGNVPEGSEILYQKIVDRTTGMVTRRPILLKKKTLLTGDHIKTARVNFESRTGAPYVSITFDSLGAKIFDRITAENVKKRLAIVLDNTVYSAPVIQERISGGQAQITGNFTTEEASDLAIVLRAGSLPAPVNIIQNVSIGPSLGRDSIEKGIRASIIGLVLVVLFMIVYYKFSGFIADIALFLNLVYLLAAMAVLDATLTLPGIAGIILTIGMAVDANVLIFERIREELRLGKTVRASIDAGYDKAFFTIVDSHITTLITAAVLFQFGTGPIKGFAVTLSLGVIINLFTSLVGTKVIFDYVNYRRPMQKLSI